ncbi:MAG: exodeoxyribonuclease V subunit gamma [Deltaproteobacteria bacterium]|nr:exodeoxyribonuclease V subunit gamma [Deltaproteobacteria bacterium]
MEGLNVFSSNRLENLGRALAGVLAEPLGSPFDPEIIIVQSKGMERWVSMQLATYHGICANCKFPFPNAFIENIFRNVLGNVPRDPVFAPEVMTWTIVKRLPSLIKLKPFKSLRVYLGQEKQGLKLFQLVPT